MGIVWHPVSRAKQSPSFGERCRMPPTDLFFSWRTSDRLISDLGYRFGNLTFDCFGGNVSEGAAQLIEDVEILLSLLLQPAQSCQVLSRDDRRYRGHRALPLGRGFLAA